MKNMTEAAFALIIINTMLFLYVLHAKFYHRISSLYVNLE